MGKLSQWFWRTNKLLQNQFYFLNHHFFSKPILEFHRFAQIPSNPSSLGSIGSTISWFESKVLGYVHSRNLGVICAQWLALKSRQTNQRCPCISMDLLWLLLSRDWGKHSLLMVLHHKVLFSFCHHNQGQTQVELHGFFVTPW